MTHTISNRIETASTLIVEVVESESLAERASLQPGDRLLTYDGQPLASPFLLQALEENTFGKDTVVLTVLRDGQRMEVEVATGKLGIEVRPEMNETMLPIYRQGRTAQEAGDSQEAARLWRQAAEQSKEAN